MATVSFKEDLEINSKDKIIEIAIALQQPKSSIIKSAQPPKLPSNASSIWFNHSEK